jgi:carbamoylphosphate synthase large subunit
MKRILVTGVGEPAGRNVAQLLLARGYAVVGTNLRSVAVPGTTFHLVPAASDSSFLDRLQQIVQQEKIDLLIPAASEELPVIAERWNNRDGVPALIGPFEAVYIANDKYLTADQLSKNNVSVPRYGLPSQIKSAEDMANAVGWPCLSKPRIGYGGRGVAVWREKDYSFMETLDDRSILQEFVPGVEYTANVCLGHKSQDCIVVLEKTRLREGNVGPALEVRRVEALDVAQLAVAAGRALGLTGPLDIDLRRRADNVPVVLEINARFGAHIAQAPEVLDAALASLVMT